MLWALLLVSAAGCPRHIVDFEDLEVGSIVTRIGDIRVCSGTRAKNGELLHATTAMIFDATCETDCSGQDNDLKVVEQGKTLILSEDLDGEDPDDNAYGGYLSFGFPKAAVRDVCFKIIDFMDPTPSSVDAHLISGDVHVQTLPGHVNQTKTVCVDTTEALERLDIFIWGSGAIDDLSFCVADDQKKEEMMKVPAVRDERTVVDTLALFISRKNLMTQESATIPNLKDAVELMDAILGSDDLREIRDVVQQTTRGPLVDFIPKWLDLGTNLPKITSYAMFPPPNQTSACSLLEMFEIYLNAKSLEVPFPKLENVLRKDIKKIDRFVAAFADEMNSCLSDRVVTEYTTKKNGKVRPRYTVDTFLYQENFPGVLEGPYVSQFWSMPYLLQQSHQAMVPYTFIEESSETAGTMLNYLQAQTNPKFTRQVSRRKNVPSNFAYFASAVHSDAVMAFHVKQLELFLASDLIRYDCSRYNDGEETHSLQIDFTTCAGCLSFYDLFYGGAKYAMLGAFASKKKFTRIRPEQMAHLIALHDESPCLAAVAEDECLDAGLPADVCSLAAQGEIFSKEDLEETAPYLFDTLLKHPKAVDFLDSIKQRQDDCLLLKMLYPEGGPPHDSFPGGHSVYAGSTASLLSGMFCLYEDEGICNDLPMVDESQGPPTLKKWSDVKYYGNAGLSKDDLVQILDPIGEYYEGGLKNGDIVEHVWEPTVEKKFTKTETPTENMTVWGEMVKLASQYTHARDRAGVHYYSDGCAGLLLGELMAIRYLIAQLQLRPKDKLPDEEETIVKPLFDGRHVVLTSCGARFWGSLDPPSLDVNFIMETSPMTCAQPLRPIRLDEDLLPLFNDGQLPERPSSL